MPRFKTRPRTVEAVQVTAGMISGEEAKPEGTGVWGNRALAVWVRAHDGHRGDLACRGMWLIRDAPDPTAPGHTIYERPLTDEEFKARYEPA